MCAKSSSHFDIEIAKALKGIRPLVSAEDYGKIVSIVAPDNREEAERIISGLSEEDEFALISRLMGTATHLIALDQSPIFKSEYIIPDFLARFRPGCLPCDCTQENTDGFNCLIEVKSTPKNAFKISGNYLSKWRSFAKTFNLPLFFAVRFTRFNNHALWIIVEDNDTSKPFIKITASHFADGARRLLWNDYGYMLFPKTYFIASYSKSAKLNNIKHKKYGVQTTFQIVNSKGKIISENQESIFYSLFFNSFDLKEAQVTEQGDLTHVTYTPNTGFLTLVDAIYKLNRFPTNEQGESGYDAGKLLHKIILGEDSQIFDRIFVERLARPLLDSQIIGVMTLGDPASHIKDWKRLGGNYEHSMSQGKTSKSSIHSTKQKVALRNPGFLLWM